MFETVGSVHQTAFYSLLAGLALLEMYLPCRGRALDLAARWPCNIGLFVANVLLHRFVLPVSAVALAASPYTMSLALIPETIMGGAIGIGLAVASLDFSKYVEHRLFHSYRCLWRIHLVHHADTELDFTTSERHHPLEALLAYPITLTLVVVLNLPPEGVAVYAVLSSVVNLWSHGDVKWPSRMQATMRAFFVTPDMHEVHHSAEQLETDSNYGLVFSVWDRALGTYVAPTANGHERRTIGLEYLRDVRDHKLLRTLGLPFVRDPISRQGPIKSRQTAE
jgi:sterol desaturase/sphingolipid hydroxylase (fatty acid hydroxylase superfamily)